MLYHRILAIFRFKNVLCYPPNNKQVSDVLVNLTITLPWDHFKISVTLIIFLLKKGINNFVCVFEFVSYLNVLHSWKYIDRFKDSQKFNQFHTVTDQLLSLLVDNHFLVKIQKSSPFRDCNSDIDLANQNVIPDFCHVNLWRAPLLPAKAPPWSTGISHKIFSWEMSH